MEALTAASVAALTIYDMCKAVDKGMTIEQVRLLEKVGGKSGHFKVEGDEGQGDVFCPLSRAAGRGCRAGGGHFQVLDDVRQALVAKGGQYAVLAEQNLMCARNEELCSSTSRWRRATKWRSSRR
jgi:hypothetical protein